MIDYVSKGTKVLRAKLPTMGRFVERYRRRYCDSRPGLKALGAQVMAGNCHPAAILLESLMEPVKGVEFKLRRGHWLGNDVRLNRKHYPGQQHSWCEARVFRNPVKFIVDPTQFVFTGGAIEIAILTETDLRYDPNSMRFREAIYGRREVLPVRKDQKLFPSHLDKGAQGFLGIILDGRDWEVWTEDEMFLVANMNPNRLQNFAPVIYEALTKGGRQALVPLDVYRDIMGARA